MGKNFRFGKSRNRKHQLKDLRHHYLFHTEPEELVVSRGELKEMVEG